MKALMPNAVSIGFTGTQLLKQDKQTSLEVFGGYTIPTSSAKAWRTRFYARPDL